jgi:hypothetical protein
MSTKKQYCFTEERLKPLALNRGKCYASDMITVERFKVGFLYRQEPDFEDDSGWRFLTGFESDQYIGQKENFGLFDVNMIANCDPEIIEYLDEPVGSTFGRDPSVGNKFVEIKDTDSENEK